MHSSSLFNIFNIAGSAMSAQDIRLNTTASNIANADSVGNEQNLPYRAKHPIFAAVMENVAAKNFGTHTNTICKGVKVDGIYDSKEPFIKEYNPSHPKADKDGFILKSNVNVFHEMTNMMRASNSAQLNAKMADTAKQLMLKLFSIGGSD